MKAFPPPEVLQQLEHLSNTWLERKVGKKAVETGFSVGKFEELSTIAERAETIATNSISSFIAQRPVPRFVTAVAMTSAGTACAFMTFTPVYGCSAREATNASAEVQGEGWTLDIMRRTPATPPGVIELLLVRTIDRFRSSGATVLNMGWSHGLIRCRR